MTNPLAKSGAGNIPGRAPLRAPRGAAISCKAWAQEAAFRLLMNSLDPDLAERAESLIPCNDLGAVAAGWSAFHAISDALRALDDDQTLLVHRGRMAGVFRTRPDAPRALIVDSDPAAAWTNIGSQLFLPQAYEIFASAKKGFFGGDLAGKFIAGVGMDGARAASPLGAAMNRAAFLGIDPDPERIKRCVKAGYCDVMVNGLDEALRILKNAVRKREAASVGLVANPPDVIAEVASRGVVPDLFLDLRAPEQKSAEPVEEVLPALRTLGSIIIRSRRSDHASQDNQYKSRGEARDASVADLLGCDPRGGYASTHCIALSGEFADTQRIDRLLLELLPHDESLRDWIRTLQGRGRHHGLPARAIPPSVVGLPALAIAVNGLAARGELKAPVALVHQRLPLFGDRPQPRSETARVPPDAEKFDARKLDALLGFGIGAALTALRHDASGAPVLVAKMVVADGTGAANAQIERVFPSKT